MSHMGQLLQSVQSHSLQESHQLTLGSRARCSIVTTKISGCNTGQLAPPPEHVDVAGLLLPRREDARGAAGGGGSAFGRQRLVRTPAVERNLRAAALALCQQQPLLLQGPPGAFRFLRRVRDPQHAGPGRCGASVWLHLPSACNSCSSCGAPGCPFFP